MTAIRPDQLEAVAARIPDAGQANALSDVGQVAAAQYGDGALRCQLLQSLGGTVDKNGRIRIRDDFGQGAVEVEAHDRPPTVHDRAQLTIGLQCVRQLRHALVAGAHLYLGEVGNHHVGAVLEEVVGMSGPVDANDECEPAVAACLDSGLGVLDDHGPLRGRAQSAGGLHQDGWVGLTRQPESFGDHAVHPDREQVAESGRVEDLFAVAARRIDGGRNPGFGQLADQCDSRLEHGHPGIHPLEEPLLLAVAESAHRVLGEVGRSPGGSEIPREARKSDTPS